MEMVEVERGERFVCALRGRENDAYMHIVFYDDDDILNDKLSMQNATASTERSLPMRISFSSINHPTTLPCPMLDLIPMDRR